MDSITIDGLDALRARLERAQDSIQFRAASALAESLTLLEDACKALLDADVYGKDRPEGEQLPTHELYNAFVHQVLDAGLGEASGLLLNLSPHAIYLEFGTDDEGTGKHWVAPVNASALHWIGPGGQDFFSGGHYVSGIHPIRFMHRALADNRSAILAIFAKHMAGLFD